MDAQNAVEPASTKPAASPKRQGTDHHDQPRSSSMNRSSVNAKSDPTTKDSRSGSAASHANQNDDAAATADGNSDAETIVLPGKDGHSPSKTRKIIKHEDKSEADERIPASLSRKESGKLDHDGKNARADRTADRGGPASARNSNDTTSTTNNNNNNNNPLSLGKKKKLSEKSQSKDGSSGLSSAPTSPPPYRRRRSPALHSDSDSDTGRTKSPRPVARDRDRDRERSRLADKLVPNKRKASKADSDEEAEARKIRRQRTSGSGLDASRKQPSTSTKPQQHENSTTSRIRSASPPPRPHRRSVSTQLPSQTANGLSHKKKRVPAPLQSTDHLSDDSSAGGSPHPRSSKLRSLTTPATTESTVSPAKVAPHKKHLDAHGQTFLARACAKGEYEITKQRLQERPEDINVADYAGNTPLQIAAINGCDDIVQLLVDAGCSLDCVNNDKDTPLLDAVENSHLTVVKILLAAGVNPRKPNAYGEEPIDRVDEDSKDADEIRRLLRKAKQRIGDQRRTSEEHHGQDQTDARSSHGPESPRRSPGPSSLAAAATRRSGTVRNQKTSNHFLYMPMDDKTLRSAVARGDDETVTRILQVREKFDDRESMVAAARGGHDVVMNLLMALGQADPDPPFSLSNDHSSPILASIGGENIKVVKLLVDQSMDRFDPTRRFKGETYYEIARKRRGPNWIEEEQILKDAYDQYMKNYKQLPKDLRERQKMRKEARETELRDRQTEQPKDLDEAKAHKRKGSSPSRDAAREPAKDAKRASSTKAATSPKEKRRSGSFTGHQEDQASPKRGPGRPKKEDRLPVIAVSDREASPAGPKPSNKAKRADTDAAAGSSEGEAFKPHRRKLVSGRELNRERDKHRRASLASTASSLKEPTSPRDSRQDEPDKSQKTEKYHDRTKALKRDDSRDRLSVLGESTGKRHRSSATPPLHSDKDHGEGPVKRRRIEGDDKEKRQRLTSSPDDRHHKPSSREAKGPSKSRDDERRASKPKKGDGGSDHSRRESGKSATSESSIHVKSEDMDVEMRDADPIPEANPPPARASNEKVKDDNKEKEAKRQAEKQAEIDARAQEAKREEEERKRREEERERKRKEDEAKEKERVRLEDEAKRRAEEEKRRAEEEERARKEEEERKRREEEERKQREEEEEKHRLAEEEKKRKEEEERLRKEEEERKRLEEEERLHQEQLEREAAEEARRKQEEERRRLLEEEQERRRAEEARRKREEEEAQRKREEMERRRAAREAELRRIREEQHRLRISKLPPLLQWLDGCANPKLTSVAEKFSTMQGVRYDCIHPEASGTHRGREQWLLNTQVALLLGEKDLTLARCKLAAHLLVLLWV